MTRRLPLSAAAPALPPCPGNSGAQGSLTLYIGINAQRPTISRARALITIGVRRTFQSMPNVRMRLVLRSLLSILLLVGLASLVACKDEVPPPPPPSVSGVQRAESLKPASAELRARYERSCLACHASIDGRAPLTGDVAQWKPRLDKGMDVLVRHAMEGFNAMPPKGLCADCSEADMRALIVFMSQEKDPSK